MQAQVRMTPQLPRKSGTSCNKITQNFAHLRQESHNSNFGIFEFFGIERNVCRCTFNRYSVITQFAKLASGEQLCHRCTRRKL